MEITKTKIAGLLIIQPRVFGDARGYFFESYHQGRLNEFAGEEVKFVQDNESFSGSNVLRGLHFQKEPFAQGKLVRVVKGRVLDVAVDIRKSSPTYGQHFSIELSEENKTQLYIPVGFAHGFVSLTEETIFQYKCTNYYSPENEGSILWNDQELGIDWKTNNPLISEKDKKALPFSDFISPFS